MESSNNILSIFDDEIDYCQNPCEDTHCHARQYLMCPHCSYHLCFEHGKQHQEQIQHQTLVLYNRAKKLEKTLNEYQPVQVSLEKAFYSLNQWKEKMSNLIEEYSQQVKIHLEQAQYRINDQWNRTKHEYLQTLHRYLLEPSNHLLKIGEQIHPDDVRKIDSYFTQVETQIRNLLEHNDILSINFDSFSLNGDIKISCGHFPSPTMNRSLFSSAESSNSNANIAHLDQIHLLYRFDTFSEDTSALGVSSYGINNSNQLIVTWIKPSTLVVFDSQKGVRKSLDVEPSFLSINDIIWSDYLNLFLIAGAALHTFDVINNHVEQILTPSVQEIWSITTHKRDLYICYIMGESPLIEHCSLPSFRTIRSYTRLQILPTSSHSIIEVVRCMRTNGHSIAMTIRNIATYEWRVDIFNFDLQRLFKGQIVGYAAYPDYWCCLLTSYRSLSWLIINNTSKPETLTLIDKQGQIIQQIEQQGYNISLLHGEQTIIIKDQQGLAVFSI